MFGKIIRDVAEGVGEVIASPLTVTRKTVEAIDREVREATEPNEGHRD